MRLNVEITREDYADFVKFHFMKTGFKKTIFFYAFLLIVALYIINSHEFGWLKSSFFVLAYSILVYFIIIRWINKSKKIPQENGSFLSNTEYVFSDEKILYKSKDSEGSLNWSIIKRFDIGKKAFYLYTDSLIAYVIPKRVFQNDEEMKAFQNLVERNIHKPINA